MTKEGYPAEVASERSLERPKAFPVHRNRRPVRRKNDSYGRNKDEYRI
jgi:hypothetical protein